MFLGGLGVSQDIGGGCGVVKLGVLSLRRAFLGFLVKSVGCARGGGQMELF